MILFYFLIFLSNLISYLYYLYLYQLKGYFYFRYLKLLFKNKLVLTTTCLFILVLTINIFIAQYIVIYLIINSIIHLVFFVIHLIKLFKNKKIKFKFTFKIFRNILIFSISLLVLLIFNINFIYLIYFNYLFIIFTEFFDFYKYFQKIYFNLKTNKYIKSHPQIIKIGITGSNGKTSVKNILYHLICDDIQTVATPKNFNTPKGIKYTICKLCDDSTQCVIFEMGARKPNDILTLCKLTKVNMGILTNVSSQHLETFKSIDRVFETKCELPNYLQENLCVFSFNDRLSYSAYKQKVGQKILVGLQCFSPTLKSRSQLKSINIKCDNLRALRAIANLPKFDIFAKNITIKNGVTHFVLKYQNEEYALETKLLGQHNISNILQATAVALRLGIPIRSIVHKIASLSPTPHRLELIKTHINILDDSYNCSILSAKNSLQVLTKFPNKKICCTPGIVEGGAMQFELNQKLAKMLKKYTDIQIIVGKTNRNAFKSMLEKSAYFVDTLQDAQKLFTQFSIGDSLLILNDLPDDYN